MGAGRFRARAMVTGDKPNFESEAATGDKPNVESICPNLIER